MSCAYFKTALLLLEDNDFALMFFFKEKPTVVVQGEYIEMESDALNQHECMASITALLKHMQTNKITPEVAKVMLEAYSK